ncbi:DUF4251 domain-containing protein [Segetibacter sp. 3557_3]|uniref:DUF4251 domain-containing protein n=1 Tax=Segetibacter sp. 3557_3 TaxID=2547429 RepID=UPI001058637E|nr:DUF4251 domain-containing protein [Segetibacter sp. 3557_3]TDH29108.1 DUF4251 domain-containing protein [Segetibacter sp. 3557_3]
MTRYNRVFSIYMLFAAMLTVAACGVARDSSKTNNDSSRRTNIEQLINARDFRFNVQTATPTGGRVIQLTSQYDLRISRDTIQSDLPFFGRAFSAPVDPTRGGFRFTSTKFEYTVQPKRKGGWDILIRPQDAQDVRQLSLSVTSSGYGTLQVTSNNRQGISYYGTITQRK